MIDRRTPEYVSSLDGVRAIAILAVLTFHGGIAGTPGGYLGVDVFFVLSGFLITSLLLAESGRSGRIDLWNFYGRRVRRLFPALAFMAIVAIGLAALFAIDSVMRTSQDLPAAMFGWMNWLLVFDHQSYFESFGRPQLLLHTWSLAVEAQYYLVWPLVLMVLVRIGGARAVAFGAGSLALAAVAQSVHVGYDAHFASAAVQSRFYYGTDIRCAGLLIGSLLAAAFACRPPVISRTPAAVRNVVAIAALAGLIAMFHTVDRLDHNAYVFGFAATALVTSLLIASIVWPGTAVGALLALPPARWLGTRSYSVYLWHWPIFQILRPGIDIQMPANEANALRLVLTLAIAELSYRLIEKPFRNVRFAQLAAWFRLDDFGAMLGACTCVILIVVAAGMTQLLGSRDRQRHDAAIAAMLRPPVLKSRRHAAARPRTARVVALNVTSAGFSSPERLNIVSAVSAVSYRPMYPKHKPAGRPSVPAASSAPSSTYENEDTTLLGDSIMLAASRAIAKRFKVVYVDAAVGRQAETLGSVISRLHAQKQLTPIVIFDVGNNGTVNAATLDRMLKNLSSCRRVIVVNAHVPRPWAEDANAVVARVSPRYENTIVAGWYRAAMGHDGDYLGEDRVHPNEAGARAYAQTIAEALRHYEAPRSKRRSKRPAPPAAPAPLHRRPGKPSVLKLAKR